MQTSSTKTLKVVDPEAQLNCLISDFLVARNLDLFVFLEKLEVTSSSELFGQFCLLDSSSDKAILQSLLTMKVDNLTDKKTAIQEAVLDLLNVDEFRNSSPHSNMIKLTAEQLKTDLVTQKWFFECYMRVACLTLAKFKSVSLRSEDRKILAQFQCSYNKVYALKLAKIYGLKLPFFAPLICALLSTLVQDVPISFIDNKYYAPMIDTGFFSFINSNGGHIFILWTCIFFYTVLFSKKLLLKCFSLRTVYPKTIREIKSLLGVTIVSLSSLIAFFNFAPSTLVYDSNSIGQHIASKNYEAAYTILSQKNWHIDKVNYVKAQILLDQKNTIPAVQFQKEFNVATDAIIKDYQSDSLPLWANNFVVAKILKERNITTELKTFEESRLILLLCFLIYISSFFVCKVLLNQIGIFALNNKDYRKIKHLIF